MPTITHTWEVPNQILAARLEVILSRVVFRWRVYSVTEGVLGTQFIGTELAAMEKYYEFWEDLFNYYDEQGYEYPKANDPSNIDAKIAAYITMDEMDLAHSTVIYIDPVITYENRVL